MCCWYYNNWYHNSSQNFLGQWKIRVSRNSDEFKKFILSFFPVKLDTMPVDNFLSLIAFFWYAVSLFLLSMITILDEQTFCLKKFLDFSLYTRTLIWKPKSHCNLLINSPFSLLSTIYESTCVLYRSEKI